MAQFDVYINENKNTQNIVPYLLDIQNDILKNIRTRTVIPLIRHLKEVKGLTKEFIINGEKVYLATFQLATVKETALCEKVCSLSSSKDEIKNSIDFLVYGF